VGPPSLLFISAKERKKEKKRENKLLCSYRGAISACIFGHNEQSDES
jgi:hypothetical protein